VTNVVSIKKQNNTWLSQNIIQFIANLNARLHEFVNVSHRSIIWKPKVSRQCLSYHQNCPSLFQILKPYT